MATCECGCGGTTKGGKFLPGHDMKLKGALKRAAAGGDKDAYQELSRRGWLPGQTAPRRSKAEIAADKAAKEQAKADAKRAAEEAAPIDLDVLAQMKAAAEVLKDQGRYRRSDPGYIEVTRSNYNDILNGLV